MRFTPAALGLVAMLAAAGCHSHQAELELAPLEATSALLFDASPGYPSGAGLMYRSDWPSTESSYTLGESIFYQERFTDMQYSSPWGRWNNDRTYRRFTSIRTGVGVR